LDSTTSVPCYDKKIAFLQRNVIITISTLRCTTRFTGNEKKDLCIVYQRLIVAKRKFSEIYYERFFEAYIYNYLKLFKAICALFLYHLQFILTF